MDGQDLRYFPLAERKHKLRSILPKDSDCIYCDHVEGEGEGVFRVACENDLARGCRRKAKIRYSQWEGREELFARERESDPDLHHWNQCTLVCEEQTMTMCEVLQFRNSEDQWGEVCGRTSVSSCDECGAWVCEQHADRCSICRVALCPSCIQLHAQEHPVKTPQRAHLLRKSA